MVTKDERYDPDVNCSSEPIELNNTLDKYNCSPTPSPNEDCVHLSDEFIHNDMGQGTRREGGRMGGSAMADTGKKKDNNTSGVGNKASASSSASASENATGQSEPQKKCIYCKKPVVGRSWCGNGFKCHTGDPSLDASHNHFCEKCARGKPDELGEADEERGEMTCPVHKKGRKSASASDSAPYQV